ncbi:MAG: type II toxin-antitoxin system VapC family toxin [Prevotellaceae bacterium]|nr:type II toxin-antitoxin system VapC family toxin [Prevotellaceae bacterium]MCD8303787.1 type II toxin-antitoxin system VapC family toxin [Prevotellaceae bacterium]
MRLYLDTNILVFLVNDVHGRIDNDTMALLTDEANVLFTSAACAHELVDLVLKGNIKRSKEWRKNEGVLDRLEEFGIKVEPVTEKHVRAEEALTLYEDHRDPIDRLIIAQAISDRTMLVSSDRMFPRYRHEGLEFHLNTW